MKKVPLAAIVLLWIVPLSAADHLISGAESSPPIAPTRIEVDLSERTMYLYHEDVVVNSYSVAVGEEEYPTPTGSFSITRIEWNPDWVPPNTEWGREHEKKEPDDPENPMVGAKLFFEYPDYYIHGTDATHTLGEAESHGCLRMKPEEVVDLAQWVQEHSGNDRSAEWFEEAQQDDGTTHVVDLSTPISIEIHD